MSSNGETPAVVGLQQPIREPSWSVKQLKSHMLCYCKNQVGRQLSQVHSGEFECLELQDSTLDLIYKEYDLQRIIRVQIVDCFEPTCVM